MSTLIKLLSTLLVMLLIVYCIFIQLEFFDIKNRGLVPNVGRGLANFMISMLLITACLIYLREWTKICKQSALRTILKYLVFPYCCVFWPFGYSYSVVLDNEYILPVLVFMCLLWVSVVNVWVKISEEYAPLGLERKMLFSHYPPVKRSDMIGLDIATFIAFLLPIFFR